MNNLKTQFSDYTTKEGFFITQDGVNKDAIRAKKRIKQDLEPIIPKDGNKKKTRSRKRGTTVEF
jgi:hypothetical protein